MMEISVGWKEHFRASFLPAWRGLGRYLGHQENFSCPFTKPCINPCPHTVSHMQCCFQTESFILLEDKIFICLVSSRNIFFFSKQ